MLVPGVGAAIGYKKRRAPRSMSSRGPHLVACAPSPVRVRGHRVDFPVPLGTSGCPAQLQVHDRPTCPAHLASSSRVPGGLPLRGWYVGFAGPAIVIPNGHRDVHAACPLGLPLANRVDPISAGRSGCPNLPSTAGFPGLRPPFSGGVGRCLQAPRTTAQGSLANSSQDLFLRVVCGLWTAWGRRC